MSGLYSYVSRKYSTELRVELRDRVVSRTHLLRRLSNRFGVDKDTLSRKFDELECLERLRSLADNGRDLFG